MSAPIIAFFSVRGGVGTTSLAYHLAWMFADLGVKVLAVDLDPQASLTSAFVLGSVECDYVAVTDNLGLAPTDWTLAVVEEELAVQWQAPRGDEQALLTLSKPWFVMKRLASLHDAQLVLVDLGPNLSAINRSGLIAADWIVLPVASDPVSVQGIETLGAALLKWREEWQERLVRGSSMDLPAGAIKPLGYVVLRTSVAMGPFEDWSHRLAEDYQRWILGISPARSVSILNDPNNLAVLKPYPSLSEMAREARKPMFHLKPADGALGAHLQAAEDVRKEFEALAKAIVAKANLPIDFDR